MKKRESGNKQLASSDLALFCMQVTMIVKSGLPLYDGINEMSYTIGHNDGKNMLVRVSERLSEGVPLSEALTPELVFPKYMINMIQIGESAGELDNVMKSLSEYYDNQDKIKKQIKAVILHPSITIIMVTVILIVLVTKVFPIFFQVYENLGGVMSTSTTLTIQFSTWFVSAIAGLIVVVAVCMLVVYIMCKNPLKRLKLTNMLSHFFVTKKLMNRIALAEFTNVMSMLLASGYNTDEAIQMSIPIINNIMVVEKINVGTKLMEDGQDFVTAFENVKLFSHTHSRILHIAQKTGSIDAAMKKLNVVYNEDIEQYVSRVIDTIEPVVTGITTVIIGGILLSVMLPLMQILSAIG